MAVLTLTGRLLVAAPTLYDPNFDRTVIVLLEHNDEGALGIILDRPSETDVADALPGWGALAADPARFFVGGPVQQDRAIALGLGAPDPTDGWQPLFAGLGTVDLERDATEVAGIRAVRVFVGYAGWGAGQLEEELAEDSWLVCDRLPDDPFTGDPDDLWRRVVKRQGGRTAWLAHFPPHPSLN